MWCSSVPDQKESKDRDEDERIGCEEQGSEAASGGVVEEAGRAAGGAGDLTQYVQCKHKHALERDYWADKNGPPILDASQDWKLLTGRQNDTHTMVRVRRPIKPYTIDDINVVDEPTWILWAWHPHDPGEDLQKAYHKGNRGKRKLCLLRTKCWPPPPVNAVVSTTTTTTSATHFHLLLLLPALLPRFL
ncbi:DBH-like monooxygenase protein 1 [Scylla paramamosain]|uniref:DBH-like monooxygenase protein 1 n=1 Tax=Scylla paramamosain TaxID=85552 RepID=UPI0030832728